MKNIVAILNSMDWIEVRACCCGHGRYPMTIVARTAGFVFERGLFREGTVELFTMKKIPRKSRFYKRDKKGYYYIPEVCKEKP